MVEPTRYKHKEIDLNIFKSFFKECGKVSKNETAFEISPVWERVLNTWTGEDVFVNIEQGNTESLKKMYENYYVNGLSEGACAGKELEDKNGNFIGWKKSLRNVNRVIPLSEHFNYNSTQPKDVYKFLFDKFYIPEVINVGRAWGWQYDDIFVNFELADYFYSLDIILNILKEYNLNKTMFIGDGTGTLSTLLYNNFQIESSHNVDLSHFLLRQYINNYNNTKIKYHYAENFNVNYKHNTQIIINQDSFPEIKTESLQKYIRNAKLNKVPFILSYNIEKGISFNEHHSDYRSVIFNQGYSSIWRLDSTIRPPYVFELFHLNEETN